LEVYVKPENDTNKLALNGLILEASKLKILPCHAVDDRAKVIKLSLSHIPMFTRDEVYEGLKKSLPIFGEVLDIGIITEKATGFFMGTGYAVLNIFQEENTPDDQKYAPLSHQISWCESPTEMFHATWNNMPTWCRYCHKEGHTKFDCPTATARILCYSCHQQGHRSIECPRRNTFHAPNKKQDRKSYQSRKDIQNSPVDSPVLKPSQELTDDEDIGSDSMSIMDDAEQIFQVNVEEHVKDMHKMTEDAISTFVQSVMDKNEISITFTNNDPKQVENWSILKRSEESVALAQWLQEKKFAQLQQSPNIQNRRLSQVTIGAASHITAGQTKL
jgi:hypothetical protein